MRVLRKTGVELLALLLITQQMTGVPAAQQEEPPTITTTTRMVLVDVIATDKSGRSIEDLNRDEFVVLEKGKPQRLAAFSLERGMAAQRSMPPALPKGVFTNRPDFQPQMPTVLLLFDILNTPRSDRSYARDQLLGYLEKLQQPGQEVAILALTNRLLVLQEPTSDRRLLIHALRRFTPSTPGPETGNAVVSDLGIPEATTAAEAAAAQRLLASVRELEDTNVQKNAAMTMAALRAIAQANLARKGRKVVVWLSGSFPLRLERQENQRPNVADEMKRTVNLLADAQISVYPVDARGLAALQALDATSVPRDAYGRAPRGPQIAERMSSLRADFARSQDTMQLIATETGGRAFLNRNDLDRAIAATAEDGASYYQLAYYPADTHWDGGFREIQVKVNRPNVHLRYRRGYYALGPGSTLPGGELREAVRFNPLSSSAVTFAGRVHPRQNLLSVEVAVDLPSLSFDELPNGDRLLHLKMYAVSFSALDQPLQQKGVSFTPKLTPAQYRDVLDRGLFLRLELPSQSGQDHVRIAVRDDKAGTVGTLNIPLER